MIAALVLAGCAGDDEDGKESADLPAVTTTTEAPTTTTEPEGPTAEAQPVTVTLGDASIELPAEVPAGPTRFVATNRGTRARGLVLVELAEGETPADLTAALAADPFDALGSARLVPGPQGVAPEASLATVVDLEAGSYAAVATLTGAQAFPPAEGMVRPFTVRPAAEPADGSALPTGPTISIDDDGIEAPEGFTGNGLFRVENEGDVPHELVLYRVADDTTYVQAVEYLTADTPPEGPPLAVARAGVGALSPGGEAGVELDLQNGIYVLACQLPDGDGEPHDLTALVVLR